MTLKLKLPSTFSDTTLPKFKIDPVLPDNGGALVLVDLVHPANPTVVSGVPANNSYLNNIAKDQANAILGAGATTEVDHPLLVSSSGWNTSGNSFIERTGKGGLHGAVKQGTSGYDPGTVFWELKPQTLLRNYIFNNSGINSSSPGHLFYVSCWMGVTRVGPGGIPGNQTWEIQISGFVSPSSNYFINSGQFNVGGGRSFTWSNVGYSMTNHSSSYWVGTKPNAPATNLWFTFMNLGAADMYNYTADLRRGKPSRAVYRMYIEDLTVSGRTYAQVDAIDYAQFTKDVLTVGGRYYGDTYTDPTTLG